MTVRSLSLSNLVAIWLESVLYGVYAVLLVPTVYVLLYRPLSRLSPSAQKISQVYLAGTFALLTFSTAHVASSLAMLLEAFILFPNVSSEAYFAGAAVSPLNVMRAASFLASLALADALMIYRLYLLWDRSVVVIVVLTINLGLALISGFLIVVFSFKARIGSGSPAACVSSSESIQLTTILTPALRVLLPTHAGILFVTNLWISILTGIGLVIQGNVLEKGQYMWKRKILIFVGESGLASTITALAALFLSLLGENTQIIPYTALAQLVAISSALMVLTVEYGYPAPPSDSPHFRFSRLLRRISTTSSIESIKRPLTAPHLPNLPMIHPNATLSPPSSVKLTNAGTAMPCLLPLVQRRLRHLAAPASVRPEVRDLELPPPTPSSAARSKLSSPFATHFPRSGVHERLSRQTFNPLRESVGKGGAVYTTFGDSSLARMLAQTKDNDVRLPLPSAQIYDGAEVLGQDKERKKRGKRSPTVHRDLLPGVYMTKAIERRIDHVIEEAA